MVHGVGGRHALPAFLHSIVTAILNEWYIRDVKAQYGSALNAER